MARVVLAAVVDYQESCARARMAGLDEVLMV
jgi:hypothetical protein